MICMLMHMYGHCHDAQSPYGGHAAWSPPESALEILDRRYASGELTKGQYERIKRELQDAA